MKPEALLEHVAWVRELSRALVADENGADDVSQETLLVAMNTPARRIRNLRAWLAGAARNLVRQDRRLESRRAEREGRAARTDRVPSPTELVEKADLQRYVVKLVLELREPYRSTVLYRYFEGLSVRQIARRTETPFETARTRLKRALEQLRTKLEQQFDGDPRAWRSAILPLLLLRPTVPAAGGVGALTGLFKGALAMATPVQIGILFLVAIGATLVFWPGGMEPTAPEVKESAAPIAGPVEPAPADAGAVAEPAPIPEPEFGPAPISLEPGAGKIVGVVTDPNNAAIEGASVTAYRYEPGAIEMEKLGSTLTDKHGAYELDVSASRVLLEAVAVKQYTLRRLAGPFSREDFVLGAPGTLAGRVLVAPTLEPCADATVGLYEPDPNDAAHRFSFLYALCRPPLASVRTNSTGEYRFPALRPGTYRLRVVSTGGPELHLARPTVQIEAGRVDVPFNLTVEKALSGRVVFAATGKPVSEFQLRQNEVAGPNGGSKPKPRVTGSRRPFFADADGRFTIWVPPGVYEIEAITLGGQRSEVERVEVTAVGEPKVLKLAVRTAGTLWGTVKSDTGPAPRMIYLWTLTAGTAKKLRRVMPDAEGSYEIRSVEAGRYILEAFCSHPGRQAVVEAELQAGAKKEVNLVLQQGLDVGVTVAGADQQPIEGAKVEINRADGIPHVIKVSRWRIFGNVSKEVLAEAGSPGAPKPFPVREEMKKRNAEASRHLNVTNAEGKLVGWLLIPGDYVLEATAEGFKPHKQPFRVEAGKTNEVVVVLQKAE